MADVLFWVFLSFFVIIGVISILAILGVGNFDPGFRKWAVTAFAVGITGAIFALFKTVFSGLVIAVTLTPPPNVPPETLDLKSGEYSYDYHTSSGDVATKTGWIPVARDQTSARWAAKLPQEVLDKPVKLRLTSHDGNVYEVQPFYPNQITANMIRRSGPATAPKTSLQPGWFSLVLGATASAAPEGRLTRIADDVPDTVKFDNYARSNQMIQGRKYYQWRVFVDEPPVILDKIEEVQYVLHRTFPNPFQVSRNQQRQFELVQSGWGEFTILITIRFKNGAERKTSYYLSLAKPWPEGR